MHCGNLNRRVHFRMGLTTFVMKPGKGGYTVLSNTQGIPKQMKGRDSRKKRKGRQWPGERIHTIPPLPLYCWRVFRLLSYLLRLLHVPPTKVHLATSLCKFNSLWVWKGLSFFHTLVNYFVLKKRVTRLKCKDRDTGASAQQLPNSGPW